MFVLPPIRYTRGENICKKICQQAEYGVGGFGLHPHGGFEYLPACCVSPISIIGFLGLCPVDESVGLYSTSKKTAILLMGVAMTQSEKDYA